MYTYLYNGVLRVILKRVQKFMLLKCMLLNIHKQKIVCKQHPLLLQFAHESCGSCINNMKRRTEALHHFFFTQFMKISAKYGKSSNKLIKCSRFQVGHLLRGKWFLTKNKYCRYCF